MEDQMEEEDLCPRLERDMLIYDISKSPDAFLNSLDLLCNDDLEHYFVSQLSRGEHFLMEPFPFQMTLASYDKELYDTKWQSGCTPNLTRLANETQSIVVAMFRAVRRLHKAGLFHGALSKRESYAIERIIQRKSSRFHWETNHKVVLMNFSKEEGKKTEEEIVNGQLQDLKDLASVLQEMFGVNEETPAPENLQNWFDSIKKLGDADGLNLWYARSHPILWSAKSRALYFEKLWTLLSNLDDSKYASVKAMITAAITRAAQKIENWKTKAAALPPFKSVLYNNPPKPFGEEPFELFRFIRVVFRHIRDWDKQTRCHKHIDLKRDRRFLQQEFIEMKVTEVFPTLLHDIYWELLKVGFFI